MDTKWEKLRWDELGFIYIYIYTHIYIYIIDTVYKIDD